MSQFADRFGHSPERRDILRRLMAYRQALRAAGIVTGFQMFDGSFLEDCETLQSRAPNDIDVVTFSHLPVSPRQVKEFAARHGGLFDMAAVKQEYLCDSYFVDLTKDARYVVEDTMYWYGLFSHQRDTFMWKGLVTIPLMSDDGQALAALDAKEAGDA